MMSWCILARWLGMCIVVAWLGNGTLGMAQAVHQIWVDPAFGTDMLSAPLEAQINDQGAPCKTLNFAIDKMYRYLVEEGYRLDPQSQGIVYALPGLYGSHGPFSSGDVFPIFMRDRVHLQGLGARRCIVRGIGSPTPTNAAPWPTLITCSPQAYSGTGPQTSEVLVTYEYSSESSPYPRDMAGAVQPPWRGAGETAEMIDGFTFQGGDVQVLVTSHFWTGSPGGPVDANTPIDARISNCVFDMRDGWLATVQTGPGTSQQATVTGPTFGLMIAKLYVYLAGNTCSPPVALGVFGYYQQRVFVFNNTFVMCEWQHTTGWTHLSKPDAVGIIDFTVPGCGTECTLKDINCQLRGIGTNCIANNLIRTPPDRSPGNRRFAMLGIDGSDTLLVTGEFTYETSNAFAQARVGSSNGTFASDPIDPGNVVMVGQGTNGPLWNCIGSTASTCPGSAYPVPNRCDVGPLPAPKVKLWDGATNPLPPDEHDPGFVGEFVNGQSGFSPTYRDWRLLPGSPLVDRGSVVPGLLFTNGLTYVEPAAPELQSFDWDGEEYGNPRVARGVPDIGYDEFHLWIMCGSYSNDSNCHNANDYPASFLNPSAMSSGVAWRLALTSEDHVGRTMNIWRTRRLVAPPPSGQKAWIQPPEAVYPPRENPSIGDPDFNKKYVAFPFGPNLWTQPVLPALTTWVPPMLGGTGYTGIKFVNYNGGVPGPVPDDECYSGTCTQHYWNTQAEIVTGANPEDRLYGNLQSEYR